VFVGAGRSFVKAKLVALACAITVTAPVLIGCQSRAGAAAVVASHRISATSLDGYVATADTSQAAFVRSQALEQLIRTQLFTDLLRKHGGVPSSGQLAGYHDEILPTNLRENEIVGAQADKIITDALEKSGFAASFVPVYLRAAELADAVDKRGVGLQEACGTKVSVNPRYGAWDWSSLKILTGVTQSNFLTAGPPAAPTGCKVGG
jgi:hypothetical protein